MSYQKKYLIRKILLVLGAGIFLCGIFSLGAYGAETKDSGNVGGDYRTKSPMQLLRQWSTLFGTESEPQKDFGSVRGDYKVKKKFGIQTANYNPSIELKSIVLENDDYFRTNFPITFEVQTTDTDGTVKKVEYYQAPFMPRIGGNINNENFKIDGITKIGESTSAPFSYTWNTPSVGDLAIIARAIDNKGGSGRAFRRFYVKEANKPPVVTVTGLKDGELMSPPHPIKVEVTVTDPDSDNGIENLSFYGKTGIIISNSNLTNKCLGSWKKVNRGGQEKNICEGGTEIKNTFTWNTPDHGNYSFRVVATDSDRGRSKLSGEKRIRIGVTDPPTISVSFPKPKDGHYHRITDTIIIPVKATDTDGDVVKVVMKRHEHKRGDEEKTEINTTAPFTFTLSNHPEGIYSYTFKAFDNDNGESKEFHASGYQFRPANKVPDLTIVSPQDEQVFQENPTIQIKTTASDSDGRIKSTQFFIDGNSVTPDIEDGKCTKDDALEKQMRLLADFDDTLCYGKKDADTAHYVWKPKNGKHTIRVVVTDNEGAVSQKQLSVKVNNPPSVSLSSPTKDTTHIRPVDIKLNAVASDIDGTISSVKFYQTSGSGARTLLFEDTVKPYEYTWQNPTPNRNVSIVAVAKDNDNATNEISVGGMLITSKPTVTIGVTNALVHAQGSYAGEFSMTATDEVGGIRAIELYRNSVDEGNKLASLTIPATGSNAKGTASYTWNKPLVGKYTVIARAKNADGIWGQAQTSFTVNDPPSSVSVSVPAPLDKRYHRTVDTITLSATASDKDGSIAKVEFYRSRNGENKFAKVGEDTTAPYSFGDNITSEGKFDVKVIAYDNNGATTESASSSITVREPNKAPTISITAPPVGSIYQPNTTITLKAKADDRDGTVSSIEFFDGAKSIGQGSQVNWAPAVGTHTVTAKAIDDESASTTSASISITVKNDDPTISALAVNALYQKGADVTMSVTATDVDSGMDRVEFYRNGEKLKESVSQKGIEYSLTLKSPVVGTYKFYAKAFDKINAALSSNTVEVKVNNPPSVTLDKPKTAEVYITNQRIEMAATATDSDGSISRVEFYRGKNNEKRDLVGTDNSSPYTLNDIIDTVGLYDYSAKTYDLQGGVAQESIVKSVRVKEPNRKPTVEFYQTLTATYQPNTTVTLKVESKDSDGSVASVVFYDSSTKLTEKITRSGNIYSTSFIPALGAHRMTAIATDNEGLTTTSDPITITIKNDAPTISAISVQSVYQAGQDVTLSVTATDSDTGVGSVKFYKDNKEMKEAISVSGSKYSITLLKPEAKTYSFYAQATDKIGAVSSSRSVPVKVNAAPTASFYIPRPPDGFYYRTTNSIPLYSSTSDSDGRITKVEFYRGEKGKALSLLATRTYTNASFADKVDNAGSYDYKVITEDDNGARAESSITTIEVRGGNKAPTVSFFGEKNLTFTYKNGLAVTHKVAASDDDGSIRNVGFYNGSSSIGGGTLVGSEYHFTWYPRPGSYTITAKAWDNENKISEEKSISVTLYVAPPTISDITVSKYSPYFYEPIDLEVTASDANVGMNGVEFVYKNAGSDSLNSIGWVSKPPSGNVYKLKWDPQNREGAKTVIARAYNAYGWISEKTVAITVVRPKPTVAWDVKAGYIANTNIPLKITMSYPPKVYDVYYWVYFYDGSTFIGGDSARSLTENRTRNWKSSTLGKHTIKAQVWYWTHWGGWQNVDSTKDINISRPPPPKKCPKLNPFCDVLK